MTADETRVTDPGPPIRWGRVALVTLLGVAFGAAPFVLAHRSARFGDWHLILSTTLTNVGTTVVLVGVVLVLERGLVGRVGKAAAASTERVVEERTSALVTQLADLRAEFEQAVAADAEARTAPVRDVSNDVSFDGVAAALEAANGLGALRGGVVAAPLQTPSSAPELVSFDWRRHEIRGDDWLGSGEYADAIRVTYLPKRNPRGSTGFPIVEVLWLQGVETKDMLVALRAEMIERGFGVEAQEVGPDLMENVAAALRDAVEGRTAEPGAWVNGQLAEWLADGWAVTDQGLVTRDHGGIHRSEFPPTRGVPHPETFEPPLPEGVDEDFWRFAVDRAREDPNHGATSMPGAWHRGDAARPYTPETSPRGRP